MWFLRFSILNASVNSTSAHLPRATLAWGICSGSLSQGWDICATLGDHLGIWYMWFQKMPWPSSCMFYSFAMKAFMGKDTDFLSQWLVHEGLDKLVEIFRGEFLILESFPVLYRSNYLSYIIYWTSKETNVANKKCISHSTNTEWTLLILGYVISGLLLRMTRWEEAFFRNTFLYHSPIKVWSQIDNQNNFCGWNSSQFGDVLITRSDQSLLPCHNIIHSKQRGIEDRRKIGPYCPQM